MSRLVVAFSEEKKRISLSDILLRNGVLIDRVCSRIQPAISALKEKGGGILVCPATLNGILIPMIAGRERDILFLIVDHPDRIPAEREENLYFLPEPFRYGEILAAVHQLSQFDERRCTPFSLRTAREEETVLLAKTLLQERYGMTENEAYHYLRRKAMMNRESLVNCAKRFLAYLKSCDNLK